MKGAALCNVMMMCPTLVHEERSMEEQQRLENQQSKRNKMQASGNYSPINTNVMGAQP